MLMLMMVLIVAVITVTGSVVVIKDGCTSGIETA